MRVKSLRAFSFSPAPTSLYVSLFSESYIAFHPLAWKGICPYIKDNAEYYLVMINGVT